MATDTLYEHDFLIWTERQANALRQAGRAGANLPLDWDNLAEEIESVGRSERGAAMSLVNHIISHLLKLRYSPATTAKYKWESEIGHARDQLRRKLEDSPSLRPRLPDIVADELPRAKRAAARSLREFEEFEAAQTVEKAEVELSAEQVEDEGHFLPGTSFSPGGAAGRERSP